MSSSGQLVGASEEIANVAGSFNAPSCETATLTATNTPALDTACNQTSFILDSCKSVKTAGGSGEISDLASSNPATECSVSIGNTNSPSTNQFTRKFRVI